MLRVSRKALELTGRILSAAALCSWGGGAAAEIQLQGRWEITMPSDPTFSGDLIIDAEGRATFSGASLNEARSGRSRGYVSRLTDAKVEITVTNGKKVGRIRCSLQSRDLLNCDSIFAEGVGPMYYMRRIGSGPANLAK